MRKIETFVVIKRSYVHEIQYFLFLVIILIKVLPLQKVERAAKFEMLKRALFARRYIRGQTEPSASTKVLCYLPQPAVYRQRLLLAADGSTFENFLKQSSLLVSRSRCL